jgi:ubiquinone/menaquinone biosynthesis C-methylase UbiE
MSSQVTRLASIVFLLCAPTLPGILAAEEPSFEIESWEERLNERQPPIEIMDAIGVTPGMVIGEIGAGSGRMTMWLAERVGTDGRVYANDIDEDALKKLKRRCERENITNIEVVLGEVEDPHLPKSALDLVFMINVYHHADDAVELVRNATPSLRAGGFLAIVECDPGKTDWGEEHHCTSQDTMFRELNEAGYEIIGVEDFLNEDALYLARPRAKGNDPR